MKKALLFAILILLAEVSAQSAGNSGLSFLKIGSGARNIALGDNGAVFSNDATAVFYNPSNLAGATSTEVSFTHNEWIQGVKTEMLATRFTLFGLNMALGLNSTRIGDIEVRERPGAPLSTFTADFMAISLGAGFAISEKFDAGFGMKYLYEGMFYEDATGFAFDFSAKYKLSNDLFVTAAVRNIGSMNELKTEATKLPTDLRVGGGYNFALTESKIRFATGLELQKYLSTDDIHVNAGVEAIYDNLVAVRVGYQTLYESKGITGGVGIQWNKLMFDYAISPFSQNLGMGHTFSVGIKF